MELSSRFKQKVRPERNSGRSTEGGDPGGIPPRHSTCQMHHFRYASRHAFQSRRLLGRVRRGAARVRESC